MNEKNKINPISTLFTMVITIIVEKMVSPYLEKLITWISSKEFKITNYLYARIAKGVMVNIPFYVFLLLVVFTSVYIINIKKEPNKDLVDNCKKTCKKDCERCIKSLIKIMRNIIQDLVHGVSKWAVLAALWIFAIAFLTLSNFVNHNVVRINNNIEILSEYIDEWKYKELKSKFYQMENYSDYILLQEDILELSAENNVKLQE